MFQFQHYVAVYVARRCPISFDSSNSLVTSSCVNNLFRLSCRLMRRDVLRAAVGFVLHKLSVFWVKLHLCVIDHVLLDSVWEDFDVGICHVGLSKCISRRPMWSLQWEIWNEFPCIQLSFRSFHVVLAKSSFTYKKFGRWLLACCSIDGSRLLGSGSVME